MAKPAKNSDSIDNYIQNIIIQELEKSKLTLINDKIIKTISLENKEKLVISEINKIIKKNTAGFFYLDEFLKHIHNKYKVKDDPKKYLITLYKEGIIIPYKREHDLAFNTTTQLLQTSEIPTKDSFESIINDFEDETDSQSLFDESITNMIKEEIAPKSNLTGEKTTQKVQDIQQNIKASVDLASKIEQKTTEKPISDAAMSALGVKINSEGLLTDFNESAKKESQFEKSQSAMISEIENRPEELLIRRKELLEKIQKNLNTFNFLDAMADLEIVIEICKKLKDDKAVEMYKKQSEAILKTGLKYESVIEKSRTDRKFREQLEASLKDGLKEIRAYWQKKDYKNVYQTLKKVATLSYYLEDLDSAIRYVEQAELIKDKI